jgi:hypothetical protein
VDWGLHKRRPISLAHLREVKPLQKTPRSVNIPRSREITQLENDRKQKQQTFETHAVHVHTAEVGFFPQSCPICLRNIHKPGDYAHVQFVFDPEEFPCSLHGSIKKNPKDPQNFFLKRGQKENVDFCMCRVR